MSHGADPQTRARADVAQLRVAQVAGWPAEWEIVPADRGSRAFRVDLDGHWFHDGIRIQRAELVRLLASHVVRGRDGRPVIRWGPEDHPLAVADTVAVIGRIEPPRPDTGTFMAHLVDGRSVELAVGTLAVGAAHVLYARMPDGDWTRFARPAYYRMAQWIVEDGSGFAVAVGGRRWAIGRQEAS